MMTNELATTNLATVPLKDQEITYKTLQVLYSTPTIPLRYRNSPTGVNDMLAAVLVGKEIGIGPMESINSIYLVNGQVSMSGKLMAALVHRAGHQIRVEIGDKKVTATAFRRDYVTHELTEVGEFTFTEADAKRAGLNDKETYQKYPKSMLAWRAITNLCRIYFSDVTSGMAAYVPEELGVNDIPIEAIPLNTDMMIDADDEIFDEVVLEGAVAEVVEVLDGEIVR
jgi:hypothetical protein